MFPFLSFRQWPCVVFIPQQTSREAKCRSWRPIHLTGRLVNNQHGPTTTLDCTGDWARCSGSQSYLLTQISIQIYSAATAAIPTLISQRHSACLSTFCPSVFIFSVSLVLICYHPPHHHHHHLPLSSFAPTESPKKKTKVLNSNNTSDTR